MDVVLRQRDMLMESDWSLAMSWSNKDAPLLGLSGAGPSQDAVQGSTCTLVFCFIALFLKQVVRCSLFFPQAFSRV